MNDLTDFPFLVFAISLLGLSLSARIGAAIARRWRILDDSACPVFGVVLVPLAVAGMNDVFNSQGYTQAAWWNRIPIAAWSLMAAIAISCNLMIDYGARKIQAESILLLVLPLLVSVSFLLIADIDSPRGGVIRVSPHNLVSLAQSLRAQ